MSVSSRPEVLVVAPLMPFLMEALQREYVVHDRTHVSDPAAFAAAAPRIRGVVANGEAKVPRALMDQLPALEVISVFGVGYDGVDVPAAHERKVPVTNTPEVLNDDVADLAIGLMLSIARRIPQADRFVREGQWPQGPFPLARKVSGARLGLVGIGRIGQAIAHRARAFGMSIAYTARSPRAGVEGSYHPDAVALAEAVDFLVVITPGGAGTRGLIDARVLEALGPKGYLINVARGSVVDEPALIDALQKGTIAGAALDVFAAEPQVPEALRAMPNVVLTPHMASGTRQTREAMAQLTFDNLRAHFAGAPLLTPVTPVDA
ncbi:2-hydroxyacid dehydrogenase [Variovorax sp. JS1663]|uniref:2-hydroxyacid dehydrogenase n=1 Tax=Variovorax sp. JS1663 TaxID=1851577 RepID=UPI000B3487CB|nr:2-hydroxyacid dehydrogenase [Variovorax sp. JS1663]OUM03280.1 hydroxyacid dehydrogenase [Variovorax sp. JS1663]